MEGGVVKRRRRKKLAIAPTQSVRKMINKKVRHIRQLYQSAGKKATGAEDDKIVGMELIVDEHITLKTWEEKKCASTFCAGRGKPCLPSPMVTVGAKCKR